MPKHAIFGHPVREDILGVQDSGSISFLQQLIPDNVSVGLALGTSSKAWMCMVQS